MDQYSKVDYSQINMDLNTMKENLDILKLVWWISMIDALAELALLILGPLIYCISTGCCRVIYRYEWKEEFCLFLGKYYLIFN